MTINTHNIMEFKKKTYEEIEAYIKEHDLFVEINQPLYKHEGMAEWVYDIEVTGDWKHDHGYLTYLMEEIGYYETQDNLIYEPEYEGSDFYHSVHRFVWKPAYEMFNGKIS